MMPVDSIQCPNSLVAFFPASVYRSCGTSTVLTGLLYSVDRDKLSAVQFLRNGAVRLTFKSTKDCESAVSNGIQYGDTPLRVVAMEPKSRLVYLRDCPVEVPDSAVSGFFSSYEEIHSITHSEHQGLPGLRDGTRVVKMTLTKDIPGSVRVAGSTVVCGTVASPRPAQSVRSWVIIVRLAALTVFAVAVSVLAMWLENVATPGVVPPRCLFRRLCRQLLMLPPQLSLRCLRMILQIPISTPTLSSSLRTPVKWSLSFPRGTSGWSSRPQTRRVPHAASKNVRGNAAVLDLMTWMSTKSIPILVFSVRFAKCGPMISLGRRLGQTSSAFGAHVSCPVRSPLPTLRQLPCLPYRLRSLRTSPLSQPWSLILKKSLSPCSPRSSLSPSPRLSVHLTLCFLPLLCLTNLHRPNPWSRLERLVDVVSCFM